MFSEKLNDPRFIQVRLYSFVQSYFGVLLNFSLFFGLVLFPYV